MSEKEYQWSQAISPVFYGTRLGLRPINWHTTHTHIHTRAHAHTHTHARTRTHTHTHTHIHTHTHTHARAHTHTYTHTHTHAHTHTHTHAHTHTHTHTHTHARTHTHTRTHAHTHTHTHTRTHTHTHTHTHTRLPRYMFIPLDSLRSLLLKNLTIFHVWVSKNHFCEREQNWLLVWLISPRLKGKFSSGIEGALASTLNHDFNWKQLLSEMILCIFLLMFSKFIWVTLIQKQQKYK